MTQLIENTYEAYNRFMEGELNQYDLASLIEDEIISEELLDSIFAEALEEAEMYEAEEALSEGWKKKAFAGALAATMAAHIPAAAEYGAKHVGDWASNKTVQTSGNVLNNSKLATKAILKGDFKDAGKYIGGAARGLEKKAGNAYDKYVKGDNSAESKLKAYAAIRDGARKVQGFASKYNYLNKI